MAYQFPLSRDAGFGTLPIWEQTFDLTENIVFSGLEDGSMLRDEIGPRLWHSRCKIDFLTFAQAPGVESMIGLLRGSAATFFAWRIAGAAPQDDPDGVFLGAAVPIIYSLPADAREITLGGLPEGYPLGPGDMLSFLYGSGPIRYALHRIVSAPGIAGSLGTITIEVAPPIRSGAVVTTQVELKRPYCKAMILPKSVSPGTVRRNKVSGLSFDFIQTLR